MSCSPPDVTSSTFAAPGPGAAADRAVVGSHWPAWSVLRCVSDSCPFSQSGGSAAFRRWVSGRSSSWREESVPLPGARVGHRHGAHAVAMGMFLLLFGELRVGGRPPALTDHATKVGSRITNCRGGGGDLPAAARADAPDPGLVVLAEVLLAQHAVGRRPPGQGPVASPELPDVAHRTGPGRTGQARPGRPRGRANCWPGTHARKALRAAIETRWTGRHPAPSRAPPPRQPAGPVTVLLGFSRAESEASGRRSARIRLHVPRSAMLARPPGVTGVFHDPGEVASRRARRPRPLRVVRRQGPGSSEVFLRGLSGCCGVHFRPAWGQPINEPTLVGGPFEAFREFSAGQPGAWPKVCFLAPLFCPPISDPVPESFRPPAGARPRDFRVVHVPALLCTERAHPWAVGETDIAPTGS